MTPEKQKKLQESRESAMKDMGPEERAQFERWMEIGDKVMAQEWETLRKLAKS